jgi:uncharacterized damage-inducible protein DinB
MMARMKSFCASVMLVLLSASAFAQPSRTAGYTSTLANSWNRLKRLVVASAEAMPDDGYAFKPSADVRSFGALIGHLADEHYMICSGVKGEPNPKAGVGFETFATKAEFVQAIKDSIAYCDPVYAAATDAPKMTQPTAPNRRDTPFSSLLMNVTHDSEHYGNIVTYLRMKGIVPPSSQPSR